MINQQRLLDTFLELVSIDSPSGGEHDAARYCINYLAPLGFSSVQDSVGNVIATKPGRGRPLLVNAHLDGVQPCLGINPIVQGEMVRSDGTTILGADDRAAVAAILEVMQVLSEDKLDHPPLEVVFTVREELGLEGSRKMDYSLISAKAGVVLDHDGPAGGIVVAAPYQNRLQVVVRGKAAHAGAAPERGINAIRIAAEAIAAMPLGRIDHETTSNIGIIRGGSARNAVPELVEIEAEARSRDAAKLETQTTAMVTAFKEAAARHKGTVDVTVTRNYNGFRAAPDDPMLLRLMAAARTAGIEPRLEESGGGSDVNVFREHGIDVLAISAGFFNMHSTAESQSIPELVKAADMLLTTVVM